MNFKERLKASIEHEDARRENVEYWREILEGAREDERLSWAALEEHSRDLDKLTTKWKEDFKKIIHLEKKVEELENANR